MTKTHPTAQEDEVRNEEPATENAASPAENVVDEEENKSVVPETDELNVKLAEVQDKYLRLAAEFDNFRKRTLREKIELTQTAGDTLLKDLLPVVDDFERGLDIIENSSDIESVKTGMTLIYNKLKDFLTNNGVSEISAAKEPFDADKHEAVTKIPAPSDNLKGKVVDVIQKGYALRDKIIRYPKVVVGE
ncbi:MAG: nucleotide exchange factor GrpE [Bacteroidales bacterium]|nr:nucleotide exchange factor GrpE [Bacteroidales bacterium]